MTHTLTKLGQMNGYKTVFELEALLLTVLLKFLLARLFAANLIGWVDQFRDDDVGSNSPGWFFDLNI